MSKCSTIKQGKIDQNIMLLVSYELIFYYLSYFFEFIIFWFQVFKCIAKICFSLISWHKWNWIFFWNKIESDPKNPSVKVSSHVLLVISCSIAKIFFLNVFSGNWAEITIKALLQTPFSHEFLRSIPRQLIDELAKMDKLNAKGKKLLLNIKI